MGLVHALGQPEIHASFQLALNPVPIGLQTIFIHMLVSLLSANLVTPSMIFPFLSFVKKKENFFKLLDRIQKDVSL
jgi:biotin transporter BioY